MFLPKQFFFSFFIKNIEWTIMRISILIIYFGEALMIQFHQSAPHKGKKKKKYRLNFFFWNDGTNLAWLAWPTSTKIITGNLGTLYKLPMAFEPWSVGLVPFPTIILVCGVLKAYVNQCGGPLVLFLFLLNGRKLLNKGQGAIISSLLFYFYFFVLFYCLLSLGWLYIFRIFIFLYL